MEESTGKIFLASVLGLLFSFTLPSSVSLPRLPFLLPKASLGNPSPLLLQYLFPVCTALSCPLLPFLSFHSSIYKRRQKGATTVWTYSKGIVSSCISFALVMLPEHGLLASELQQAQLPKGRLSLDLRTTGCVLGQKIPL